MEGRKLADEIVLVLDPHMDSSSGCPIPASQGSNTLLSPGGSPRPSFHLPQDSPSKAIRFRNFEPATH